MNILLADDHAVVRRGIRELLSEKYPEAEFTEAANGRDALVQSRARQWDLIVLDISMPEKTGLEALAEISADQLKTPVLVLSQHEEREYAVQALRSGAKAYVVKRSALEELLAAVAKVLAGGWYVSTCIAEQLAARVGTGADDGAGEEPLSERELQVLRRLADGMSLKEIAHELAISQKTVSTYKARLLEKLHLTSNAELIRYALRVGVTR